MSFVFAFPGQPHFLLSALVEWDQQMGAEVSVAKWNFGFPELILQTQSLTRN